MDFWLCAWRWNPVRFFCHFPAQVSEVEQLFVAARAQVLCVFIENGLWCDITNSNRVLVVRCFFEETVLCRFDVAKIEEMSFDLAPAHGGEHIGPKSGEECLTE